MAVRYVTEKLTAREDEELRELIPLPSRKHALVFFGQPSTILVWEEWALELVQEQQPPLKPGMLVSARTELWTLLKGYMRAKQQLEIEKNYGGCACLCKTYFMPKGCGCRPPSRGFKPMLDVTLCPKCSTCLRCGKLPGSTDCSHENN